MGIPATGEEMNIELESIECVDLAASVKKLLPKTITEFIEHCCQVRH